VVVGAGISGIACARALVDAGLPVQVLDRGRAIGGRMASRRLPRTSGADTGGHITDIGASYFTARDPAFVAEVEGLILSGVVRAWTDAFEVFQEGRRVGRRAGPMRYAAPRGLRSVVEALAVGLPVTSSTEVGEVHLDASGTIEVDGLEVEAVALCMPGPQAERLLAGTSGSVRSIRQAALGVPWEPVIAVAAGFDAVIWDPFDGMFVNEDPTLTWVADDGARRANGAAVLVGHVTPALAEAHLAEPDRVREPAVAAMRRVLAIDAEPIWVDVQRWTFARPTGASDAAYYLDSELAVGLAGDAWSAGPRVEAAWCSGRALGQSIAQRLDGRR